MEGVGFNEDTLFQRLSTGGFTHLLDLQLRAVAAYFESRSIESGFVAPMLVAQATRAVQELMEEHDEYGGIRLGFVKRLDAVAKKYALLIRSADPKAAASIARDFRDEVRSQVRLYDANLTYE